MRFVPVGEQIDIIASDKSALVLGGPGRGKTATALAAAARWLEENPRGRALFTSFSNAAVQRLAAASEIRAGSRIQFRTFHSISLEILKDYGRFVGLGAPARALDTMEERLVAAEHVWPTDDETAYGQALEEYARRTGKVPFALMVPWATALLRASPTLRRAISARYPFVVIDEFQDTSAEQWDLLKVVAEESRVLALGDEHQMIYGHQFRATLERFAEFEEWKGIKRTPLTVPNFRCSNTEILEFAEAVLHGRRAPRRGAGLSLYPVYRKQVRARLAAIWARFRDKAPEGKRLAFLVPSARKGEQLMDALGEPKKEAAIPVPIRPRMELEEGRVDAFKLAVFAAADYLTSRNKETLRRVALALETFVALCTKKKVTASDVEKLFAPQNRATSAVRDLLRSVETKPDPMPLASLLLEAMENDKRFESAAKSIRRQGVPNFVACESLSGSLFEGYRSARPPRMDGHVPSRSRTSMLSMHRCKGREFDYVVMIVDPYAHQAEADIGELRRLHYVAATRAKEWLGVVYVSNDLGGVLAPVLG